MRIVRTENVQGVYGKNGVRRVEPRVAVAHGKDSVSFSSFAQEMKLATRAVKEAPEVRMDKVNQLREQIAAGKYNISAAQIAEKILGF